MIFVFLETFNGALFIHVCLFLIHPILTRPQTLNYEKCQLNQSRIGDKTRLQAMRPTIALKSKDTLPKI